MSTLLSIRLVIQMLSAIAMIGLILMQQGKGADMGAAFGSGASGSLFGASGGVSFLSRTTAILATIFFACTLILAYFGNTSQTSAGSVLESVAPTPVAPASAPAAVASGAAQIPTK